MTSMRVGIASDFFARGLRDYADWRWAWVRELCQNSMDCGSQNIHFWVRTDHDGNTVAVCHNDGPPMDRDTLLDKFLCLGGTTKSFEGTVGGFGIAKTVIALAHRSYRIETGNLMVQGSGGDFDLTEDRDYPGTRTTVVMQGDHTDRILSAIRQFTNLTQWSGTFHVNGIEHKGDLRKGSPRRHWDFATVYTRRLHGGTLVVRAGGIPMYTRGIRCERCVIVELDKSSGDVLTSNRDGLNYPYSSQLIDFLAELAVDKRQALRNPSPQYVRYEGELLGYARSALELVQPDEDGAPSRSAACSEAPLAPTSPASSAVGSHAQPLPHSQNLLGMQFIIKNETNMKVPAYFDPSSSKLSSYARKLARMWGRVLIQLHRMMEVESQFSIGFLLSAESEAQFEDDRYGRTYLISPARIVEQGASSSKSFQKRLRLDHEGRKKLIALAAHEFVHGIGYRYHDEDFACRYTDVMGLVLARGSDFTWCFR